MQSVKRKKNGHNLPDKWLSLSRHKQFVVFPRPKPSIPCSKSTTKKLIFSVRFASNFVLLSLFVSLFVTNCCSVLAFALVYGHRIKWFPLLSIFFLFSVTFFLVQRFSSRFVFICFFVVVDVVVVVDVSIVLCISAISLREKSEDDKKQNEAKKETYRIESDNGWEGGGESEWSWH